MSTPRTLELPERVRRVTIESSRGCFAALEAEPAMGVAGEPTAAGGHGSTAKTPA